MINLVPPAGLTVVKKEYWLRVCSVWLLLFGTICLIGTIFLLPTYIKLSFQINDAQSTMSSLHESVTSFDLSAAQVVAANTQAMLLVNDDSPALSSYVAHVESVVQPGISLTGLVLRARPDSDIIFTVSGQAEDRQTLVAFRDALEASEEFIQVMLPISNLIINQNIPFSMDIMIAPSTSTL